MCTRIVTFSVQLGIELGLDTYLKMWPVLVPNLIMLKIRACVENDFTLQMVLVINVISEIT